MLLTVFVSYQGKQAAAVTTAATATRTTTSAHSGEAARTCYDALRYATTMLVLLQVSKIFVHVRGRKKANATITSCRRK